MHNLVKRFVWLTLAMFIGVACTKNTDPATAGYWIDRLDDKHQRNEALKELAKIGDRAAVPRVLELFAEEGEWQPDAAYTLGQLGDPSVVPTLVAAIDFQVGTGNDPKTRNKNRVNINIARALASLRAEEGVSPLIQLMDAPEARVREAVIRALGELGDYKATEVLVKAALEDREPFIRKVAVEALGDLGDPSAVPALIEMLYIEAPGTSFYNEARFSLVQIGAPAVPLLMQTMRRENENVEKIRMADGSKILDGAVEAKAASVLGAMRAEVAEGPMVALLERYYKTFKTAKGPMPASVPGAVIELSYALSNMGGGNAVKAILPVAKDTDPNLRLAATEALTALGDHSAAKPLLAASKTGELAARAAALVAASRLGTGDDLDVFMAQAQGADEAYANLVRLEAVRLEAAKQCGADPSCWMGKLTDQNSRVRERAAYQLGWMAHAAALPGLMKAAEDDDPNVRMAAVLSIGRLGTGDPDALMAIHDRWKTKMNYAGVNQEIRRVVAQLRSQKRVKGTPRAQK